MNETDRSAIRGLVTLMGCQVLGAVGVAVGLSLSGILVLQISGSVQLSGLTQSIWIAGTALAAIPFGWVSAQIGRRGGLSIAYACGGAGLALIAIGADRATVPLVLIGSLLLGATSAGNYQARFAGAELNGPFSRATRMSLVLWASTFGVIIGPLLLSTVPTTREAMAHMPGMQMSSMPPALTNTGQLGLPFWIAAAAALAASLLALTVRVEQQTITARSEIVAEVSSSEGPRQRMTKAVVLSVVVISSIHGLMITLMSFSSVHLQELGLGVSTVGYAMSAHLVGMYVFAPVFGRAVAKVGAGFVSLVGVVFSTVATLGFSALSNDEAMQFVCLLILGVGWSATIVGASSMLVAAVPARGGARVESVSDSVMSAFAAVCSVAGGFIFSAVGMSGLATTALVLPGVALIALVTYRRVARNGSIIGEPA